VGGSPFALFILVDNFLPKSNFTQKYRLRVRLFQYRLISDFLPVSAQSGFG